MIDTYLTIYIIIGLITAAMAEYGFDRKRQGDPGYQNIEGEYTMLSRILAVTLWPVVVLIAVIISYNKRNKDGY